MPDIVASCREVLESHFARYPDVPREVIIKEHLLREGVSFTDAALEAGRGHLLKSYGLFTFDKAAPGEMPHQEFVRAPEYLELHGGLYGLRPYTMVRVRLNPSSPYVVDGPEGRLQLCDGSFPLAEIREYPSVPKYYAKSFPDGTPYSQVVDLLYGTRRGQPRTVALMVCQRWDRGEECWYCDINENIKLRRQRGALTTSKLHQSPERVAQVLKEAVLGEDWEGGERPKSLFITGGSILGKFQGLAEDRFFQQYMDASRYCCGADWPLEFDIAMGPKPKAIVQRLYAAGLRVHRINYEVWDERIFALFCPSKQRITGREEWLRLTLGEVEVFGAGNVYPGFVAGVEMAQPWGFKTVDEAIESNRQGFEYLMSHGVLPRPIHWVPEPHSHLKGCEPPPLDYFIRLDVLWYETWKKYSLPHPPRAESGMGPGYGGNFNSAFLDVGD